MGGPQQALAAEERSIVLAAALKEHEGAVTNLWVGEGAIGISFSSFSTMNMPKVRARPAPSRRGVVLLFFLSLTGTFCAGARHSLTHSRRRRHQGVVPRGGSIVVTDVDAAGPAAAFGIGAGDLIVSINGDGLAPGTTKDAFLELLLATPRPVCIGFRLQKAQRRP